MMAGPLPCGGETVLATAMSAPAMAALSAANATEGLVRSPSPAPVPGDAPAASVSPGVIPGSGARASGACDACSVLIPPASCARPDGLDVLTGLMASASSNLRIEPWERVYRVGTPTASYLPTTTFQHFDGRLAYTRPVNRSCAGTMDLPCHGLTLRTLRTLLPSSHESSRGPVFAVRQCHLQQAHAAAARASCRVAWPRHRH